MKNHSRILVVDDEDAIANLVKNVLEQEYFEVKTCYDSRYALDIFQQASFDLVILDVMMPYINSFELCGKLRAISEVPVLFLSAKADEADQVVGFSLGADDYILKPFRPRELVARVRARLRRANSCSTSCDARTEQSLIFVGDLTMDTKRHSATLLDEKLNLTPTEFAILSELAKMPDEPVASRDLFERIWEEPADASAANTVMVHIRNLRRKLNAIEGGTVVIDNVWGVGYALREKR